MTLGGQGDVLPALSEYTSRRCRMALAHLCLEAATSEEMNLPDPHGYIARQLNVTKRTVRRWRGGGIQSCNVNADKLIELAYRLCPDETDTTLREDLELHRITYLNGQGAVRIHSTLPLGGGPGQDAESNSLKIPAPATHQEDTT